MKALQFGILGLIGLGATTVMAEPLYMGKAEITVGAKVITSFGITDTMYGLTAANCDTRASQWLIEFGYAFTEGTDAQIAVTCVPLDEDGSYNVAKIGL